MARTAQPGINASEIQNSTHTFASDAGASDAYAIILSPAISEYIAGQRFTFKANTANTGAASLNVNSLGAITIKKSHDQDLATGDIEAGSIVEVVYDGTNLQMVSITAATAATGDVTGPAASVDDEIALFSSTTGKVIKRATLTGLLKAASGVIAAAVTGTDYIAPGAGNADASVTDASTTAKGKVELATSAEVTTGTDATRAITPDAFADSEFGKQPVFLAITSPLTDAATGDGQSYFRVPSRISGMNLVSVRLTASTPSTSGAVTVQLRRSRRTDATTRANADMLSTALTLDANEYDSADAATAAVINTSNDDVTTGDYIFADVDGVGTGSKGLGVLMVFQLP